MTNWTMDEHGNRTFTHNGWTVRIWEKSYTYRIDIDAPHRGEEVEVTDEGIWVRGASDGSWHEQPEAFVIPWPIIGAIIEAQQRVAEREREEE